MTDHLYARKLARILRKMGTHNVEDLLDEVYNGKKQVFTCHDSVLFTQLVDFPRMRVLEFFVAVGSMADMLDLERQATEFAVSVGATRIRAFARPGWARSRIRHGAWSPSTTVWHKDL